MKSENERKVLLLIKENNQITSSIITEKLKFSKQKVDRLIASLRNNGVIKRLGSNKTGTWEVLM